MNQNGDSEKKSNFFTHLSAGAKGLLILGVVLLVVFFAGLGVTTGKQILTYFPTATAVPTLTPTVDLYTHYLNEVTNFTDIWSYYDPMDIMFNQVEGNIMLALDPTWQAEVLSHMKIMTDRVCRVEDLTPPPSLHDYHNNLLLACEELRAGQPNLKTAFDYLSRVDTEKFGQYLREFHQHFINATIYISDANSMDISQ